MVGDLNYVLDDIYPYYFGRRDEFIDKNGIFDTTQIQKAIDAAESNRM